MEFEYGKVAYLKMLELEKELSSLKNSLNQKTSNSIYLVSENDDNNSTLFSKTFMFNVFESGKYNFHGLILTESQTENQITVDFTLNNELVLSLDMNTLSETNYSFDTLCQSGKNELIVTFTAESEFNLKKINVNLIRYEKDGLYHKLSVLNYETTNYILNVSGNDATLLKVKNSSNKIESVMSFKCKDAQLIEVKSYYAIMVFIDDNSSLKIKVVDFANNRVTEEDLGVSGVNSVCAYKLENGQGYKIIFSRFSQIYYCYYNVQGDSRTFEKTARKGNLVYAETNVCGVYLIVDFTSKTKLVIE